MVLHGDVEPPTISAHPMVTRARSGITKLNVRYLLQISTRSAVPTSIKMALVDPIWKKAVTVEIVALDKKCLVPRDPSMNVLSSKWVYKHKLDNEGKII